MAGTPPAASEPVTVTVARQVAPGREADFEEWAAELTGAASGFPGWLGSGLLRPNTLGQPWHVVFRFDSGEHLAAWEDSPVRRDLLRSGSHLMETIDVQRVSGLETWFSLPGRTAPAPPKWKMFVVSVVAIYTLQFLLNLALGPFGLPVGLRTAVVALAVTALMTWLVMPRAARLLANWLYAPPRRS
jgi:antibiotic biosynthesis monooxygenase (ABM) superfamily enzyme